MSERVKLTEAETYDLFNVALRYKTEAHELRAALAAAQAENERLRQLSDGLKGLAHDLAAERDAFIRQIADIVDPTECENTEPPHARLVVAAVEKLTAERDFAASVIGHDNWTLALMYRNERELRDEARAERDTARAAVEQARREEQRWRNLVEEAVALGDLPPHVQAGMDAALASAPPADSREAEPRTALAPCGHLIAGNRTYPQGMEQGNYGCRQCDYDALAAQLAEAYRWAAEQIDDVGANEVGGILGQNALQRLRKRIEKGPQ